MKNQYKNYNKKDENELNLIDISNCLGYIEIPKINVYLPIYEGTSDEVLLKGIGHLKNTSLPIGGKSTNSVLVGHTGITAKTFFDDLVKMELGDEFYIYILEEILKYKVTDIKVVLPNDTENIKVVDKLDLVTLVTCTPKYINSHRLLVIGERMKIEEMNGKKSKDMSIANMINEGKCFIVSIIIITIIFVLYNEFIYN